MSSKDRVLLILSAIAGLALVAGYTLTGTAVTVSVDGIRTDVRTHRTTVADVLDEIGLSLSESDIVSPALSSPLPTTGNIVISRARQVIVRADGRSSELTTHAMTTADVLREAGVQLRQRDQVLLNDQVVDPNTSLEPRTRAGVAGSLLAGFSLPVSGSQERRSLQERPARLTVSVRRAMTISVSDGTSRTSITTAAKVVGEALFSEGIYIYASDLVTPTLEAPLSDGMLVIIQRAKPVTITADDRTFSTRTQAQTVIDMLNEEGLAPRGKDYSTPPFQTAISAGMDVRVTRVREETVTESEGIAFKTVYQPDPNLELDQQRIVAHGKRGVFKRTIRIVYENGKEISRVIDSEWTDEEPTTQVIAYGTKVVVRTLTTPDGPIEFWREIRVWATFYTPLLSGTPLDAPYFGITYTGQRATKGIIAVDPRAIRLHTRMYVPGYGFGAAEDTGNLVTGMVIDLCYDDDDSHPERWTWARWTTAYLLTPVPADIPYILPDFPREPR